MIAEKFYHEIGQNNPQKKYPSFEIECRFIKDNHFCNLKKLDN